MGISSLHKFLRKNCPEVYEEIHLSKYAFKKIAIDISLYLFKYKTIFGDRWISAFINLVSCMRRNNIHCVFIYDTGSPPEKQGEKEERAEAREKLEQKVYDLEDALDHYHKTSEILPILIEFDKKRKTKANLNMKRLLKKDDAISIPELTQEIQKIKNQAVHISSKDFEITKILFDVLKVPYFQAPLEAETMCSDICIRKQVDAVISEGELPVENSYSPGAIDDYLSFSESRTGNIDFSKIKSTVEFIKLLSPFLRANKKFSLVNKWQWLLTDTRRVSDWFKAMMDYWISCGGLDATIIRSSNEQKGFDQERFDREGKLLDDYLFQRGYSGSFKYIAIDDSQSELHARCLLGSLCGIHLDFGLEMTPKRHPWSLMNRATFNAEYKLYLEGDVRDRYPN